MEYKNEHINRNVSFEDFTVERIIKSGTPKKGDHLNIGIRDDIQVSENSVSVILELKIDSDTEDFELEVSMIGNFLVEEEYIETLKPNLLAIMFPYIRSAVTYITSIDGKRPIILPAINFVEYSKEDKESKV